MIDQYFRRIRYQIFGIVQSQCSDLTYSPEYLKSMEKTLQAEHADQDACNKARSGSMKETLEFPEGRKQEKRYILYSK